MYFKKLFHIVLFLALNLSAFANLDSTYSEANQAYQIKNFETALTKYQMVLDSGFVSDDLYYNIAKLFVKKYSFYE